MSRAFNASLLVLRTGSVSVALGLSSSYLERSGSSSSHWNEAPTASRGVDSSPPSPRTPRRNAASWHPGGMSFSSHGNGAPTVSPVLTDFSLLASPLPTIRRGTPPGAPEGQRGRSEESPLRCGDEPTEEPVAKIYFTNSKEYMNSDASAAKKLSTALNLDPKLPIVLGDVVGKIAGTYRPPQPAEESHGGVKKCRTGDYTDETDEEWQKLTSKRIITHPRWFGLSDGHVMVQVLTQQGTAPPGWTSLSSSDPTSNKHQFRATEGGARDDPYEKLLILVDVSLGLSLRAGEGQQSAGEGQHSTVRSLQPAKRGVELWEEVLRRINDEGRIVFPPLVRELLPWSSEEWIDTSSQDHHRTFDAYILNGDEERVISFATSACWAKGSIHVYGLRSSAAHDAWTVVNKQSYVWPGSESALGNLHILTLGL